MARKKALPTRRGRAAREAEASAEGSAEEAGDAALEAQASADEASEAAAEAKEAAAAAGGGGLEMALIVVTFVALVAAFALLQYEMRHAFGEGWPV